LAGCTTAQGAFGSYGSTRACYGDAVEAVVGTKLTGGAASWSEASTTCDFYYQHPNAGRFVDFTTTPQVYTPPTPGYPGTGGWASCGYTKYLSSTSGTINASYAQLGDAYSTSTAFLCTSVTAGRIYAFNTAHQATLTNGTTYWTNQAASEWGHA
jgi:hypothetical protein